MRKVKISLLFGLMFTLMAVYPGKTVQADPLFSANMSVLLVAKKYPVPFHANIKAMITDQVVAIPIVYIKEDGIGNATHLGKIEYHMEETVIFDAVFNGESEQDIILTAANGDKLYIHSTTKLTPISGDPLILDVQGSGGITGGTGRFEGASGTLQVKAIANTETSEVTEGIYGNIMY
jgi:hypothetical protein